MLAKLQTNVSQQPGTNDFDTTNPHTSSQRMLHKFKGSCIRPPFGRVHQAQLELLNLFYLNKKNAYYTLTPGADEALYGYCEDLNPDPPSPDRLPQFHFCDNDPFSPDVRRAWCDSHSDTANFILTSFGIGPRTEQSACNHQARVCVLLPGDPGDYGSLPKLIAAMDAPGYTVIVAPFSYTLALTLRADAVKYDVSQPIITSTPPAPQFHSISQVDDKPNLVTQPSKTEEGLFVLRADLTALADLNNRTYTGQRQFVAEVQASLNNMLTALRYYNTPENAAQCGPGLVPAPSLKPGKNRTTVPRPWACVAEAEFLPVVADSAVITHEGFQLITTAGSVMELACQTDPALVIKAAGVRIGPVHRVAGSAVAAYGPTAANLILDAVTVDAARPGSPVAPVALLGERYIDVSNVSIALQAPAGVYSVAVAGAYVADDGGFSKLVTLDPVDHTGASPLSLIVQGTNVTSTFYQPPLNVTDLTTLIAEMGIEKERRIFTHAPSHDAALAILAGVLTLAAGILTLNIAVVRRLE